MAILVYSVVEKDTHEVVFQSPDFDEAKDWLETAADHDELALARTFVFEMSAVEVFNPEPVDEAEYAPGKIGGNPGTFHE
jgi:hypothetical protein